MKYCWILLVVSGCAAERGELPAGRPMPVSEIRAALEEWDALGMPRGECSEHSELRVHWAPYERMAESCQTSLDVLACFWGSDDTGGYSLIMATPGDRDSMRHEMRHWLAYCSGLGGDPHHEDARVWTGVDL